MKDEADVITAARLRTVLRYDRETGVFTWRVSTGNRVKEGAPAGHVMKRGYVRIRVDGRQYKAHRLAWLYVTGAWPKLTIDHENRVKNDNRFSNLVDVSQWQHNKNRPNSREVQSAHRGVYFVPASWRSYILFNGKRQYLGAFQTEEDAVQAQRAATLEARA